MIFEAYVISVISVIHMTCIPRMKYPLVLWPLILANVRTDSQVGLMN